MNTDGPDATDAEQQWIEKYRQALDLPIVVPTRWENIVARWRSAWQSALSSFDRILDRYTTEPRRAPHVQRLTPNLVAEQRRSPVKVERTELKDLRFPSTSDSNDRTNKAS